MRRRALAITVFAAALSAVAGADGGPPITPPSAAMQPATIGPPRGITPPPAIMQPPAAAQPVKILLRSDGGGEVSIEKKNGSWERAGAQIPERNVAALLAAAAASEIVELDPANLGVDASAVEARQGEVLAGYHDDGREVMREAWTHAEVMRVLPRLYRERSSGAQPVRVEIVHAGGRRVVITSSPAPAPFLLPWTIAADGRTRTTWDSRLARAVAALLPPSAPSAEHGDGRHLFEEIAHQIFLDRLPDFNRRVVERTLGASVKPLTARFRVERAETATCQTAKNEDSFPCWRATLSGGGLPAQLAIAATLPLRDGKLASVKPILGQADGLARRVSQVAWLGSWLSSHPGARVEVRFHGTHSVDLRGAGPDLLDELARRGRGGLAGELAPQLAQMIDLRVVEEQGRWSDWLLLPDGRMLLVRVYDLVSHRASRRGAAPALHVLNWNTAAIPGAAYTGEAAVAVVHALVTSDGALAPPPR